MKFDPVEYLISREFSPKKIVRDWLIGAAILGSMTAAAIMFGPGILLTGIAGFAGLTVSAHVAARRNNGANDLPECLSHDFNGVRNNLVKEFSSIAKVPPPFLNTLNATTEYLCMCAPREIYTSRPMLDLLTPLQTGAIHAHEVGHLRKPFTTDQIIDIIPKLARLGRGATLGAAAVMPAVFPAAALSWPVIAGIVAAPYILNLAAKAYARRDEYAQDRFSAVEAIGSPVPLAQSFRKFMRTDAMQASPLRPFLRKCFTDLGEKHTRKKALVRLMDRIIQYEGPFTNAYPSHVQRRRALHKLPRNPQQLAKIKQIIRNGTPLP